MNSEALKFNADYELQLQNRSSTKLNEHLEFLLFFIEHRPIINQRNYDPDYIEYVESIIKRKVILSKKTLYKNWWGDLSDIELEKFLNSKKLVTLFDKDSYLMKKGDSFHFDVQKKYVAKALWGMSGRGNLIFQGDELIKIQNFVDKWKEVVVEPFFNRLYDFSQFVFPDGYMMTYENVIDSHFHYKGSCFNRLNSPTLESLSFFKEIEFQKWKIFRQKTEKIVSFIRKKGGNSFFSIDSFIYLDQNEKKIRFLNEVNYRKTMGYITWLLSQVFANHNSWTKLILKKSTAKSFLEKLNEISSIQWQSDMKKGCLLLSPPESYFDIYFFSEENSIKGEQLYSRFKEFVS